MNRFEPQIVRHESLPSTNTEAARLAQAGAEEWLAVIADEQTAGRGRLQRAWSSPRGAGLYLSVLLRPKMAANQWPLMSLMTAIAVHDALKELCGISTDIKWPNDVLAGERKICGILAEAIETPQGRAVVLGIGINLNREAFPAELSDIATSVSEITDVHPDREVLLSILLRALAVWYTALQTEGGAKKVLEAWTARSSFASGKPVRVSSGNAVFEGITCGLESDGALRIQTECEGLKIVRTGDVVSLRPIV